MSRMQQLAGRIVVDVDTIRADRPWHADIELPPPDTGGVAGSVVRLFAVSLDRQNPNKELTVREIRVSRPRRPVRVDIGARSLGPGGYQLLASLDYHDSVRGSAVGYIEGPSIWVYE